MARIAIDARVITGERDGVGRYARELVPAVAASAPCHQFLVLRHPSDREPLAAGLPNVREVYLEGVVGRLGDHFVADHRRLRATFDAEGWPDLYHALFHMYALRFPGARKPRPAVVVTLHDLIWLDHPLAHGGVPGGIGSWVTARIGIVSSLRRADQVIAVSAATAATAGRWLTPGRLTVVHHGVGARFHQPPPPLPKSVARLEADGQPWIAAVGSAKKYKNLPLVLHAFAIATRRGLDARLVLMGRCTSLARLAESLEIADRVVFPGEVGDEVLRALIGRAALFVHPALVEGFGLPVVEAMALGVPTAVADVPALREIGGDGVLRFGARDNEALAKIIEQVIASGAARAEWSAKALTRAACFDWKTCAERTLEVYARALSRH